MTYHFRNPNLAVRRYGMGDDEDTISLVVNSFLGGKIHELAVMSQAQTDAAVAAAIAQGAVSPGVPDAPVSSATTTASGSTSPTSTGAGDFIVSGSVCKAKDFPALTAAKTLQMQLNRVAKVRGYGTISVDGAIGSATLGLFNKVGAEMGPETFSSCADLTSQMNDLINSVQAFADSLSAPPASATDLAKAASAGTISVPTRAGKIATFKPPGAKVSIMDRFNALPDAVKLGGIAALGLGGILLIRKMRTRGGGRSPSASTTMLALPAQTNPARRRRRARRR